MKGTSHFLAMTKKLKALLVASSLRSPTAESNLSSRWSKVPLWIIFTIGSQRSKEKERKSSHLWWCWVGGQYELQWCHAWKGPVTTCGLCDYPSKQQPFRWSGLQRACFKSFNEHPTQQLDALPLPHSPSTKRLQSILQTGSTQNKSHQYN